MDFPVCRTEQIEYNTLGEKAFSLPAAPTSKSSTSKPKEDNGLKKSPVKKGEYFVNIEGKARLKEFSYLFNKDIFKNWILSLAPMQQITSFGT